MATNYPSGFIGPVKPGDTIGGVNPLRQSSSSNPNYQVGGWYDGRQWDGSRFGNPGETIVGGGGGTTSNNSGSNAVSDDQAINDMYAPALQETYNLEGMLGEHYNTDKGNLESQVGTEQQSYNTQQQQLLGDTDTEENRFNQVIQSALAEAVRAYNALNQQRFARFGLGSSAGQAVGELAQQEYFRQQGNIGTKQVQGAEDFGKERINIKNYIADRMNKLADYKKSALDELKKNLDYAVADIRARRNDIEANKTRDKMAALQSAIQQAREIENTNKQLQSQIAMGAINSMQTIRGTAFTPQEIKATLSEFGIDMPALGAGGQGTMASAAPGLTRSTANDPYADLIGQA